MSVKIEPESIRKWKVCACECIIFISCMIFTYNVHIDWKVTFPMSVLVGGNSVRMYVGTQVHMYVGKGTYVRMCDCELTKQSKGEASFINK